MVLFSTHLISLTQISIHSFSLANTPKTCVEDGKIPGSEVCTGDKTIVSTILEFHILNQKVIAAIKSKTLFQQHYYHSTHSVHLFPFLAF
jgi:hypothetical protein